LKVEEGSAELQAVAMENDADYEHHHYHYCHDP
jgi:hypothetical protein